MAPNTFMPLPYNPFLITKHSKYLLKKICFRKFVLNQFVDLNVNVSQR